MNKPKPPRGGAAPMLMLMSAAALLAGLGFDFSVNSGRAFWIGAEPGARALIAVIGVSVVVLAAHVLRLTLGREHQGGGDGGD